MATDSVGDEAAGSFTLTVEERDDFLLYTWVLKEGRTVPEGEWVFAGQYNHDRGGRDARDDSYVVVGDNSSVGGDFAAQDDDEGDS